MLVKKQSLWSRSTSSRSEINVPELLTRQKKWGRLTVHLGWANYIFTHVILTKCRVGNIILKLVRLILFCEQKKQVTMNGN